MIILQLLRLNNILNNTSYSNKYFYIATGTSIDNDNNKIIGDYYLEQNYPNPFNPITQITFALPKASIVELKVFDILGQEISTLIKEEKSTGIYKINFNGSNLPSGVYFYRLQAGDFVETKKMILLK